ncbi:MAG: efflux transporter periplasmic adaptor subunit, partial [Paenibacillus sp.]|nr:efflux transporter periplasmic adaptor subunit [Paenibacillus sp.]
ASLDVMTLPIQVDELDLVNIKPGLKAEVTVDAMSGRTFQGEVLQVSTVGTTTNGVTYYDAVVAVDNKDQLLKYGMTGTAQVLIQDKQNVLRQAERADDSDRGDPASARNDDRYREAGRRHDRRERGDPDRNSEQDGDRGDRRVE